MDISRVPDIPLVHGDFLASKKLALVRVLCRKSGVEIVEASDTRDDSIRKAVKKLALFDSTGQLRDVSTIVNELTVMKLAQHPHVMKMESVSMCKDYIAILMPMCSRGSLDRKRADLTQEQVDRYFVQTACGLRYLHNQNIVHGDIKLGNIFIDASDNAILSDFGHSRILPRGQDTVTTWGGTLGYRGPEFENSGVPIKAFPVSVSSYNVLLLKYTRCSLLPLNVCRDMFS